MALAIGVAQWRWHRVTKWRRNALAKWRRKHHQRCGENIANGVMANIKAGEIWQFGG